MHCQHFDNEEDSVGVKPVRIALKCLHIGLGEPNALRAAFLPLKIERSFHKLGGSRGDVLVDEVRLFVEPDRTGDGPTQV